MRARRARSLAALVLAFASALLMLAAPQASAAPFKGPYGTVCDERAVGFQSPSDYSDWGIPGDPSTTFPSHWQTYGPTYLSSHPYKSFDRDRPFRRYQAELLTPDWGGRTQWFICRGEGPAVYLQTMDFYCLTAGDPVKYPGDEIDVMPCVESANTDLKFRIHTNEAGWSVIQDERWGYFLDAVRTSFKDEVFGTVWTYTLKLSADNALAFRMV
ncbi:hypothetical protein [Kitasatospora sp. NPDC059327]|uniref:hypothetical protein n=1 Tax=Kitasatospora sp. NPDC059327 TaxID=3346803 RepID=UPI003676D8D2